MSSLTADNQERIRFHLSITEAIYDGDRAIVDYRLSLNYSELVVSYVRSALESCDRAWEAILELTSVYKQQLVTGDVNRSITDFEASRKVARKRYEAITNELAAKLGLPNYTDPGSPFLWRLGDSAYINRISNPDGTSVGARIYLHATHA
jgi:hypothetical protein